MLFPQLDSTLITGLSTSLPEFALLFLVAVVGVLVRSLLQILAQLLAQR